MSVAVSARVRAVLSGAVTCGRLLTITERLDPLTWDHVKRVVATAGATWSARQQGYVFPGDAAVAVAALAAADRAASPKQRDGWFPTPADVAEDLLDLAELQAGLEVLEPSAGEGALAAAATDRGCVVDCAELDDGRAAALAAAGAARTVTRGDFLDLAGRIPPRSYDRIVMNPPFAGGADSRHVLAALPLLRPGGICAAIMGAGLRYRSDRATTRIREMSAAIIDLPRDAFAGCGGGASVMAVIRVPGGPPPGTTANPRRVTFTNITTVPLFSPATSRDGVYVYWDSWTQQDRMFAPGGPCAGCGRRTWRHDDGDEDRAGVLGEYTCLPVDAWDLAACGFTGIPPGFGIPRCGPCWDDPAAYDTIIAAVPAVLDGARSAAAPPAPAGMLF